VILRVSTAGAVAALIGFWAEAWRSPGFRTARSWCFIKRCPYRRFDSVLGPISGACGGTRSGICAVTVFSVFPARRGFRGHIVYSGYCAGGIAFAALGVFREKGLTEACSAMEISRSDFQRPGSRFFWARRGFSFFFLFFSRFFFLFSTGAVRGQQISCRRIVRCMPRIVRIVLFVFLR